MSRTINANLFTITALPYNMSAFNDFLGLFQLNVSVYHNARICGDWRLNAHDTGATCFHMPTQGSCILDVPNEGKWRLNEGDLAIFPKEIKHSMYAVYEQKGVQQHLPIRQSQSIDGTSMLCGVVTSIHRSSQHLVNMLPAVLIIAGDKAKKWISPLTDLIVLESLNDDNLDSPILKRLSELLFAYALRCYAENFEHESGVLALYMHPRLAPAINAIHTSPEKAWQLASLASECALSRTQFAKLFTEVSGYTVMQYLTWWRMQVAWSKLNRGNTVEQTAEDVGYRSTAAFSRAFKSEFEQTVGSVRRRS